MAVRPAQNVPGRVGESDWPDPLHEQSGPTTFWSTVNLAEAIPGVPTPMSWSIFSIGNEVSVPYAYCRLGVLPRRLTERAESVDERFAAIFYGRAAMNVTHLRQIADLTPGTSGDAMEEQLLGSVRDGVPSENSWRRLPFVLGRFPAEAARLPRRLQRLHQDQHRWWSTETRRSNPTPSLRLLAQSVDRFDAAMRIHIIAVAVTQALFEQIMRLARAAGDPGLVTQLAAGYGGYEEARMVAELWNVSRGALSADAFVARYGFHGPEEGEISSTSWREDPSLVTSIADRYTRHGVEDRATEQADRRERRVSAERSLLANLPGHQQIKARAVLRLAQRYLPLREVGKAAFLMGLDVARFAARRHGAELVAKGLLARPDDVFSFTVSEVARGLDGARGDVGEVAARRQAKRVEYQTLSFPDRWEGMPQPRIDEADRIELRAGDTITGVSITGGVVEGSARVATSLEVAEELEPEEILVCEVTDPSWCTLFPLVAGMVVDIGGPLSHAAIVAREMGIPCVVNTGDAVARISTGMRIRLDATNGVVLVLDPRTGP
jgi:phosphohistidine swiveling domain-containing protein